MGARRGDTRAQLRAARRLHEASEGVSSAAERLAALGLTLPPVTAPVAAYVPAVQTGSHIYVSGQVPVADGKVAATGKVGAEVSAEDAAGLARICALDARAAAPNVVGGLGKH